MTKALLPYGDTGNSALITKTGAPSKGASTLLAIYGAQDNSSLAVKAGASKSAKAGLMIHGAEESAPLLSKGGPGKNRTMASGGKKRVVRLNSLG